MASPPIELDTAPAPEVESFLDSFDTVLTDCDGVLWEGPDAIQGSPEAINLFRQAGKRVVYVTNNGTKSRREYVKKCQDLGFGGDHKDIFTTSYLCAKYLQNQGFNKKVYLFGNKGVGAELDEAGIAHTGSDPESDGVSAMGDVANTVGEHMKEHSQDIGAVIATYNFHINVAKMAVAASYLENPDVLFIGTNRDPKFPFAKNVVLPGTGAFIKAVEVASGRDATILGKPEKFMFQGVYPGEGAFIKAVEVASGREATILGKPEKFMYKAISEVHKIDPSKTIMIGDRADTDILFGKNNGVRTLMVGSGIHGLKDVQDWLSSSEPAKQRLIPEFYLPSLGRLVPHLKKIVKA